MIASPNASCSVNLRASSRHRAWARRGPVRGGPVREDGGGGGKPNMSPDRITRLRFASRTRRILTSGGVEARLRRFPRVTALKTRILDWELGVRRSFRGPVATEGAHREVRWMGAPVEHRLARVVEVDVVILPLLFDITCSSSKYRCYCHHTYDCCCQSYYRCQHCRNYGHDFTTSPRGRGSQEVGQAARPRGSQAAAQPRGRQVPRDREERVRSPNGARNPMPRLRTRQRVASSTRTEGRREA